MRNLIIILILISSCKSSKDIKPIEEKVPVVQEKNGFRELKIFTVYFEYNNGNELSFTIEIEPTEDQNAMDMAFNQAEKIALKDSTVVMYTVRPERYMKKINN